MEVLDDIVGERPRIVLCGMAGAQSHRHRDHFYETPGNSFWGSLHDSGLTPRLLSPEEDVLSPRYGLALTDLVRHRGADAASDRYEVEELVARIRRWHPEWLAFTSKTVAQAAARSLGERRPELGPATWQLADTPVFVLPGTSGANRRHDYDGRPDRLSWWRELAAVAS